MRIISAMLFVTFLSCNSTKIKTSENAVSHELWDQLLKAHVSDEGKVDYENFMKDHERLKTYLALLSNNHPNSNTWSREERLAYWINAYNAFTVELILRNYPLESIKDIKLLNIPLINTPWHIDFIELGGKEYNLNNIEHDILREEFDEPRIHFAINCASVSCPVLLDEAYTAKNLEKQLDQQAIAFINDPLRNKISKEHPEVSKIFSWFKKDFTRNGSLIDYLNQYSKTRIDEDAKVGFLEYDWRLNE